MLVAVNTILALWERGLSESGVALVCPQVTKEDRTFQNIMKSYRTQPQASSTVRPTHLSSAARIRTTAVLLAVFLFNFIENIIAYQHPINPSLDNSNNNCIIIES